MDKPRTIMEYVNTAARYLQERGCPSPRLDAELLLAYVLKLDRMQLYVQFDKPLTPDEVDAYRATVGQRGRRIPVAQITGQREFLSRPFFVNSNVLSPRPETELLVEAVLELLQFVENPTILDIGTGSGAIAISLDLERMDAAVTAVDLSADALQVARQNGDSLGAVIEWLQSDLFQGVQGRKFSCIVSNPPYIPSQDLVKLSPEVQHEPNLALDGGSDGLQVYRALLGQAGEYLLPGGTIALEIGWDQGPALQSLLQELGFIQIRVRQDYAGHDRVVTAEWPQ